MCICYTTIFASELVKMASVTLLFLIMAGARAALKVFAQPMLKLLGVVVCELFHDGTQRLDKAIISSLEE